MLGRVFLKKPLAHGCHGWRAPVPGPDGPNPERAQAMSGGKLGSTSMFLPAKGFNFWQTVKLQDQRIHGNRML